MMRSRRESSNKLYNTYLTRWLIYSNVNGKDPIHPSVPEALEFLQSLLDDNVISRDYSAIATARSALSSVVSINGVKFGDHPAVRKCMKGVYNIVSPEPRYTNTWDPGVDYPNPTHPTHPVCNLWVNPCKHQEGALKCGGIRRARLSRVICGGRGQVDRED